MDTDKLNNIINSPKDFSNKDLESSLIFLSKKFDILKKDIIDLTLVLDITERDYNKILNEYNTRK